MVNVNKIVGMAFIPGSVFSVLTAMCMTFFDCSTLNLVDKKSLSSILLMKLFSKSM